MGTELGKKERNGTKRNETAQLGMERDREERNGVERNERGREDRNGAEGWNETEGRNQVQREERDGTRRYGTWNGHGYQFVSFWGCPGTGLHILFELSPTQFPRCAICLATFERVSSKKSLNLTFLCKITFFKPIEAP